MKKFVTRLVVFALLFSVLVAVCEVFTRTRPSVMQYRTEWLDQHADSVELLITGNSHTFLGLNPAEMPQWQAFNVAWLGQRINHDYFFLEHNIDRLPRLRYYVIAMSPWTPFTSEPDSELEWADSYHYMLQPPSQPSLWQRITGPLEVSHGLSFRFKMLQYTDSPLKYYSPLGQNSLYTRAYRNPNWKRTAIKANMVKVFSERETNHAVSYIRRLAALCRDRNIRLVMVQIPHHKLYNDLLNPDVTALYYSIVDSICREYPEALYLDYLTDTRFTDDDFDDTSHINTDIGAAKLSRIVAADIIADSIARSQQ